MRCLVCGGYLKNLDCGSRYICERCGQMHFRNFKTLKLEVHFADLPDNNQRGKDGAFC
jgi:hypothetical protein